MIHASIRKALLQKCRRARERMKEGAGKLARSAVASPVQIAYQAAWKRVLREAAATANTKRTQLLRGVRE